MSVHALIVDDSQSMRSIVRMTLTDVGYEVTEACDGNEALSLAKNHKYDVVITDVNMPGKDGIALIKELRETNDYRHTPILTLTTQVGEERKDQGRVAGATGWITKPFAPKKLIEVLGKLVG